MFTKWNEKSLSDYDKKVSDLLTSLENHVFEVYIGKGNSKTDCVEEGTSAGLAGTCDRSCCGNCREGCYAIVHQDGIYPSCRLNHAKNTISRRRDRIAYYENFFKFAEDKNKPLRVNESGDFECVEDVTSLIQVAKNHPTVKVIGYTHRENLISVVGEANKLSNVMIHYSVGLNGDRSNADKCGVPIATITFDKGKVRCLNQLFKAKGRKWTCRMCAEKGIGCFANKDMIFNAH